MNFHWIKNIFTRSTRLPPRLNPDYATARRLSFPSRLATTSAPNKTLRYRFELQGNCNSGFKGITTCRLGSSTYRENRDGRLAWKVHRSTSRTIIRSLRTDAAVPLSRNFRFRLNKETSARPRSRAPKFSESGDLCFSMNDYVYERRTLLLFL